MLRQRSRRAGAFRHTLTALAVLLASLAAGPASAQSTGHGPAAQTEATELQGELMTLQQQLAATEAKVMKDPDVVAAREELDAAMQSALREADPKFEKKVDRIKAIAAELEEKSQAGAKEGELMPLLAEGQAIQKELQAVQIETMKSEPLESRVQSFHDLVRTKMIELDPKASERMERAEQIVEELQKNPPAGS